jgi:hypothetical protein
VTRATAFAPLLLATMAAASGCGSEPADLFVVKRAGEIPGARLELRVTDDGRVSCNGRSLVDITSEQLVDARDIERRLEPLARRGVALPPARGSILRYRVAMEDGALRFADNSPHQPAPLFALAKLTRDVARGACGLAR